MCGQNKNKETAKIYINTTDKGKEHVPLLVNSKTVISKTKVQPRQTKDLIVAVAVKFSFYLFVKENYAAIRL